MSEFECQRVRAPDGIETVLRSKGPRSGRGLILIHGVEHCSLVWKYQFADPALAGLRMAAYDVRGHGEADKPAGSEFYEPDRLADELDAVITASGLDKPVLLGWSLGARVIFSYLDKYGWDRIGGLLIAGGRVRRDAKATAGAGQQVMLLGCSDDLETRIHARREFVRACHEIAPSPNDLVELVNCAMLMPPAVLRQFIGRPMDFASLLPRVNVPIRVIHGARDAVCPLPAAALIRELNPAAEMIVYEGVGHSPFYEQPSRFNQDLLDFVG
jgi:pimeloyl-ACP methyl ester carboxylesterase